MRRSDVGRSRERTSNGNRRRRFAATRWAPRESNYFATPWSTLEPAAWYIPLEQSRAAVDLVGHRLLPVKTLDIAPLVDDRPAHLLRRHFGLLPWTSNVLGVFWPGSRDMLATIRDQLLGQPCAIAVP